MINYLENTQNIAGKIKPEFLFLQKELSELITSIILTTEAKITNLINNHFLNNAAVIKKSQNTIKKLILEITDNFFNNLYLDVQSIIFNDKRNINITLVNFILHISKLSDFGPHRVIDRLYKITSKIHLNINRDLLDDNDFDTSILKIINTEFKKYDILHSFSVNSEDNIDFLKIDYNDKLYNNNYKQKL